MRGSAFAVSAASIPVGRILCLRGIIPLVSLTAAFSIAGCGSSGGGGGSQQPPAAQTINFATPATQTVGTPLTLSATATSGLVVSFASTTSAVCTVSGSAATFVAAGTCSITASQAGDAAYAAATPVPVSFTVNAEAQTINFPAPATQTVGTPLTLSATATSGLAVSFASTTSSVCTVSDSTATFVAAGTCSITASQPGNSAYAAATPVPVSFTVNPVLPTITAFTPRYVALDVPSNTLIPYTITCEGCDEGDILHDVTGIFGDLTLPSAGPTVNFWDLWQLGDYLPLSTFQPAWDTNEIQHPGGPYGNQASTAFMGTGSQSTLVSSPLTGTLFQVQQTTGQIATLTTSGETGILFPNTEGTAILTISAHDDATATFADVLGNGNGVGVYDDDGTHVCTITLNVGQVSGIAVKGGYMVFTDPVDNLVGIAKMDCSGYQTISVAGQPWAVAIANGEAYILSRDKWSANGLPGLTKIGVPSGTIEASVELTGLPPVSTVRAANPYAGIYQVQAFSQNPLAAVLFADAATGSVLTINTKSMTITSTTAVPNIPTAIAAQDTASNPIVWINYLLADSMEAVTHIGAIDPSTGNFTPDIGSCQTAIGGFIWTENGVVCAQGITIQPPQNLQP